MVDIEDTASDAVDQVKDFGKDLVDKGQELVDSISFAPSVQVHIS